MDQAFLDKIYHLMRMPEILKFSAEINNIIENHNKNIELAIKAYTLTLKNYPQYARFFSETIKRQH